MRMWKLGWNVSTEQRSVEVTCLLGRVDLQKTATQFKQLLAEDRDVAISLAKIDVPDTASLQLMVAFTKDMHAAKHQVEWLDAGPSLQNAIALLDLTTHLFSDNP